MIRAAWQSSKKGHQPDFDDLIQPYQNMLQARAEAAIVSGVPGDGPLVVFDQAAIGLRDLATDIPEPEEVKEELGEGHDHDVITEAVVAAQAPKKKVVKVVKKGKK